MACSTAGSCQPCSQPEQHLCCKLNPVRYLCHSMDTRLCCQHGSCSLPAKHPLTQLVQSRGGHASLYVEMSLGVGAESVTCAAWLCSPAVQQSAITALASAASCLNETFQPYAAQVLPMLYRYLTLTEV